MELHTFAALLRRRGGAVSHVLAPPYLVHPGDTTAYSGAFFRERGIRITGPRLLTPFEEVRQATSGRGASTPYAPGEGIGYWRAAALHLGRQQRELWELMATVRGG